MFYKMEDGGYLNKGPFVLLANGTLLHPDYLDVVELPQEGWYYFTTEEEAKSFFNIE